MEIQLKGENTPNVQWPFLVSVFFIFTKAVHGLSKLTGTLGKSKCDRFGPPTETFYQLHLRGKYSVNVNIVLFITRFV